MNWNDDDKKQRTLVEKYYWTISKATRMSRIGYIRSKISACNFSCSSVLLTDGELRQQAECVDGGTEGRKNVVELRGIARFNDAWTSTDNLRYLLANEDSCNLQ